MLRYWVWNSIIIMIMMELTGEGRACIPVGLIKTYNGLSKSWTKCVWKVEKEEKTHDLTWAAFMLECLQVAARWIMQPLLT